MRPAALDVRSAQLLQFLEEPLRPVPHAASLLVFRIGRFVACGGRWYPGSVSGKMSNNHRGSSCVLFSCDGAHLTALRAIIAVYKLTAA